MSRFLLPLLALLCSVSACETPPEDGSAPNPSPDPNDDLNEDLNEERTGSM